MANEEITHEERIKLWQEYQQALFDRDNHSGADVYFKAQEKVLECEKRLLSTCRNKYIEETVINKKYLLTTLTNLVQEDKIKGPMWKAVQSDIDRFTGQFPNREKHNQLQDPFAKEAVEFIDALCDKASKTTDMQELKRIRAVLWREKKDDRADNVEQAEKNRFLESALSNKTLCSGVLDEYLSDKKRQGMSSDFDGYKTVSLTPKAVEGLVKRDDLTFNQFLALDVRNSSDNPEYATMLDNKFMDYIVAGAKKDAELKEKGVDRHDRNKEHIIQSTRDGDNYVVNHGAYDEYLRLMSPDVLKREDVTPEVVAYADSANQDKSNRLINKYASVHGFNSSKMREKVGEFYKELNGWFREKTMDLPETPSYDEQRVLTTYTYARLLNHMAIGVAKKGESFELPYTPDEHMKMLINKRREFEALNGQENANLTDRRFAKDYTTELDNIVPKTETFETIREVQISKARQMLHKLTGQKTPTETVKEEREIPAEERKIQIGDKFKGEVRKLFLQDIARKTKPLLEEAFANVSQLTGVDIPQQRQNEMKEFCENNPYYQSAMQSTGTTHIEAETYGLQSEKDKFGRDIGTVIMKDNITVDRLTNKKVKPKGLREQAALNLLRHREKE